MLSPTPLHRVCESVTTELHALTYTSRSRCFAVYTVLAGLDSDQGLSVWLLDPTGDCSALTCACVGGGILNPRLQQALRDDSVVLDCTRRPLAEVCPVVLSHVRSVLLEGDKGRRSDNGGESNVEDFQDQNVWQIEVVYIYEFFVQL